MLTKDQLEEELEDLELDVRRALARIRRLREKIRTLPAEPVLDLGRG